MFFPLSLNHQLSSFIVMIALSLFSTSVGAVLNNGVWKVEDGEFPALIDSLRQNARDVTSVDLSGFGITAEQFRELHEAILSNRRIGHIRWGHRPQGVEELVRPIEDRIHENNIRHSYYPSDYVHGLLSEHSYSDSQEGDEVNMGDKYQTPPGWRVAKVFQEEGYYSVLYAHEENGHLVLAHRGTRSLATIKADVLEVLSNFILSQQAFAYLVTEWAVQYTKAHHYNLSITGHSLGGWLAELSAYFSVREFGYYPRTVTFDSPGAYDMMETLRPNVVNVSNRFDPANLDIVTYLSAPNIVNCCGKHPGQVYRLFPELTEGPLPGWFENLIDGHVLGQLPRAVHDVKERHLLNVILGQFDPVTEQPREYAEVIDWPRLDYPRAANGVEEGVSAAIVGGINMIPGSQLVPDFAKRFVGKGVCKLINRVSGGAVDVGNVLCDVLSGKVSTEQYWGVVKAELVPGLPRAFDPKQRFYLQHKYHYNTRPVELKRRLLNLYKGARDWYLERLHLRVDDFLRMDLSNLTRTALSQVRDWIIGIDHPNEYKRRFIETHIPVDTVRSYLRRSRDVNPELRTLLEQKAGRWEHPRGVASNVEQPRDFAAGTFVERRELMNKIHGALSSQDKIAVIRGPMGTGKTTLAHAYVKKWKEINQSNSVRFLKADSGENLAVDYRSFAESLNVNVQGQDDTYVRERVHHFLSSVPQILLVFDNVETEGDVEAYIASLPKNVTALLTTRNGLLFEHMNHVDIGTFTHEEAAEYMRKAYEMEKRQLSVADLEDLLDCIGTLPIRLSWALGYLLHKEHRLTRTIQMFVKEVEAKKRRGEIVDPVFTLVVESLKQRSLHAWRLLQKAALLDPDFIPLELLDSRLPSSSISPSSNPSQQPASSSELFPPAFPGFGREGVILQDGPERPFQWCHSGTGIVRVFREAPVDGSKGDCGFIAIGTSRPEAIKLLIDNAHDPETRRLIAPEIRELVTLPLDEGPWSLANIAQRPVSVRQLRERFHTQRSALVTELEAIRNQINNELELGGNAQLTLEETQDYLANIEDEHAQRLDEQLQRLITVDYEMEHYIPTPDELIAFVQDEFDTRHEYLSYFRGGGGTLEALARLSGFEVTVFTGEQELVQTFHVDAAPGNAHRYLLHHVGGQRSDGRSYLNHFNLFNEIEPKEDVRDDNVVRSQEQSSSVPLPFGSGEDLAGSSSVDVAEISEELAILQQLEKAIAVLESSSLATFVESEEGVKGIRVHRLAQEESIRYGDIYPNEAPARLRSSLLELMNKHFPLVDWNPDEAWKQAKLYFPHVKELLRRSISKEENEDYNMVSLLGKLGSYYKEISYEYRLSTGCFKRAFGILQTLPHRPEKHLNTVNALNIIGNIYIVSGQPQEAISYFDQALNILKANNPGKIHPASVVILANIGWAYLDLGSPAQALVYLKQALGTIKTETSARTAALLNNVGLTYRGLREPVQALDYFTQSLLMYGTLPNSNKLAIANVLNNIGLAHIDMRHLQDALDYLAQALQMHRSLFPPPQCHPEIAKVLNSMGTVHYGLGNRQEALDCLEQSLQMRRSVFSNQNHPGVVASLITTAKVYMEEDNFPKARDYCAQALGVSLTLYPNKNHSTLAMAHGMMGHIDTLEMRLTEKKVTGFGNFMKRAFSKKAREEQQTVKRELEEMRNRALSHLKEAYSIYLRIVGNTDRNTLFLRNSILELDPRYQFPQVEQPNPQGQGTKLREERNPLLPIHHAFLTYYARGLDEFLPLRIQMLGDIKPVKLVKSQWLQHDGKPFTLSDDVLSRLQRGETVLIPYNLWGQHWVGIALEREAEGQILVNYMDPENRPMPQELADQITSALLNNSNLHFVQIPVEQQRYNNCGPEVIENFVLYLTGNRVSQEEAVPLHSWLLERRLVPADEATQHKVAFLKPGAQFDEKLIAQTQHYAETGEILPTLQLAINNGVVQLFEEAQIRVAARQAPATIEHEYIPVNTFDEKLIAQARHYEDTGEMFQTLQNAMGRGLAYFRTGEAL